jgi:hypothetical protein
VSLLDNILSAFGQGGEPHAAGSVPGFAGGEFGPRGMIFDLPHPAAAQPRSEGPSKFRNTLGAVGDALLVATGEKPMYRERMMQRRLGDAVGNYLGNTDAALAEIFRADPETGLALYKAKHGASEQPSIAKEVDYYRSIGRNDLADQLLEKHAQGAPLISNNGDGTFTIVPQAMIRQPGGTPQGGTQAPSPTIDSQEAYDALPPGAHYRDSQGNEGVKGGPTAAAPSGDFR